MGLAGATGNDSREPQDDERGDAAGEHWVSRDDMGSIDKEDIEELSGGGAADPSELVYGPGWSRAGRPAWTGRSARREARKQVKLAVEEVHSARSAAKKAAVVAEDAIRSSDLLPANNQETASRLQKMVDELRTMSDTLRNMADELQKLGKNSGTGGRK